jgi:hypothetical protein
MAEATGEGHMTRHEAIEEQQRLFPGLMIEPGTRYTGMPLMLPEICLALRSALNGSSDPWPDEYTWEVVAMLKARIATWQPSLRDEDSRFDEAVRLQVEAVLELAQKRGFNG